MKKYNFVYETTFNNGLYYRGQHKTDDLNDNYFGSSKIVKDLVRNHPELNPQRKILKLCNTQEELNYWEKYYIGDLYKTDPNCLNENNVCTIPEFSPFTGVTYKPFLGHNHTEESKELIRYKRQFQIITDETKQLISDNTKKLWQNTEFRNKTIKAQKEAQNRQEVKQKKSEHSKEMWQNEEFRIKRKQSLDSYWENPEAHKRQSEAQKKRYKNSNDAQKHSDWAKEYYKTHEGNRKNKKCSEETKRKNSEQSKDRAWLSKQGERSVFVKKDKFNYYLILGYHFGRN